MKALASLAILGLLCAPAAADLMFSSTFDGSTVPWNWDGSSGSPSGTNQMDVAVGPTAGASYVNHVVSGVAGDGTGTLNISFDVDCTNMAFDGYYSGPAIAEVGTVDGNKSVFGDGVMARVGVVNWKADPGQTGQYRFGLSTYIRYWNGSPVTSGTFSPGAGQTPIYQVDLTITAAVTPTDDWTITADMDVTGPTAGIIDTLSCQSVATRTDADYDGLLDINEYFLGVLNTGNTVDGTSLSFDNFNAVPEPATLGLLALGGLAALKRRR